MLKKYIDALRDNRSSPGEENGIKAAGNKCISGFLIYGHHNGENKKHTRRMTIELLFVDK